jgi:3-oxoacyl-[acyl-carrier protein] reductase
VTARAEPSAALVLGGSGGIGGAVSGRLAVDHAVAIGYRRDEERATRVVERIRAAGGVAIAVRADATAEEGVAHAFDAAGELGPLRTVVHCVGGWGYPRLVDLTAAQIDEELSLNLRSALLALAEGARRVQDDGRIVMLSSAAADVAPPRQSVYAAAKAGVEAAARVAAKELAARRITVNVVRPGATDTATLRAGTSEKAIAAMAGANAMRRLGTPDDIAAVVALLCSVDAGWVTGAVVDATGGLR